jgi:predicted aldo/keto reductase-like oxidoreductase
MENTAKKGEYFLKKHNLKTPDQVKEAAIKFVLSNPKVQVLTLAFHNFENVSSYLKLSGSIMNAADRKALTAYSRECHQLYCRHACGLCEAKCPSRVPVNTIMRYNHYFDSPGGEKFAMQKYADLSGPKAGNCQNCSGNCEAACPYGVPIQGLLTMAHEQLTLA